MIKLSKFALLAASTSILIACGGGGGNGSDEGGDDNVDIPWGSSTDPTEVNWVSFSIGADYAAETGITGEGSTVAIIDTGIDWTHEALQNANIAGNYGANGIEISDDHGHGTAMASTIVGVYSDGTIFGVAPETSILNIDASDSQYGYFYDNDLADGIEYAVANGADIISMSLGADWSQTIGYGYTLEEMAEGEDVQAISAATSQGVIVVMASGNSSESNAGFPAYFAGSEMYNGLGIAVVALDANNEITYFSNGCNTVDPTYCLAAPGEDVTIADADGGYNLDSDGTSQATAIVSGSFALLREYFPDLSSEDIVQIMLMTADDLGEEGVDEIYGSGAINLEQALQPIGTTTLANGQNTTEFEETQVTTSSAMNGAFSNVAALQSLPVYDIFNREYAINFSNVGQNQTSSIQKVTTTDRYLLNTELTSEAFNQLMTFELAYGDLTDWSSFDDALLNVNTSIESNPFLSIADFNGAVKASRADSSSHSSLTFFGDSDDDQTLAMVSHTQYFGNFDIGLGFSRMNEDGQVLGTVFNGGFGDIDKSTTDSVHFGFGWSNHKYGFDARGNISKTNVEMANTGLITGFDEITSNSWAIGAHVNNIIRDGDRLDFGVGQSIVVSEGNANLDADALEDGASNVVSLAPSGKETTYELGYRAPIAENIALLLNASLLTESDNDADAEDEGSIGMRVEFTF